MHRKPIILILTSRDEEGNASVEISRAIKEYGTHNTVIVGDDKYGSAAKSSKLDKLMTLGDDYQEFLGRNERFAFLKNIGRKNKPVKKGRAYRIANAVKRYRPELVLTTTPYAYFSAVDSKRKTEFDAEIVYMMPYFVLDKQTYGLDSIYIVENQDVKTALVSQGVPSKRVMTMGFPYDIPRKTPLEIVAMKQELGLPRTMTVFLNAEKKDGVEELFSLLLDQGGVINIVVYCTDAKTVSALRARADSEKANNVVILQKEEQFDEYLTASDAVITRYDVSTIYKCFKLGKPVITFAKGAHSLREIAYLVEKGLVMNAKENIEVVGLIYKLIETGVAASYVTAGQKWVETASVSNIAGYLVSYIGK